jgi:uncharacterized membrane protein
MEAFSDGVIAVALTIMVLGQRVPEGTDFAALLALAPQLLTYILSFVYVGIYWTNHHHLLQVADRVNGVVLWANLHLLFWLTLIPLTTAWMKENVTAPLPTAIYGVVLLLCGLAYYLFERTLIRLHGRTSSIARALGADNKTRLSVLLYALAIPLAFVHAYIADALYVAVAALWLVPDRRIEASLTRGSPHGPADRD